MSLIEAQLNALSSLLTDQSELSSLLNWHIFHIRQSLFDPIYFVQVSKWFQDFKENIPPPILEAFEAVLSAWSSNLRGLHLSE